MKSLRRYIRQSFDKGAVLAMGFGCLYLYKQEYVPDVTGPLSYGIITAGAIGYTRYIIQGVETTIENEEYQKLLQMFDEQKCEIMVNRNKLEEVRDACQSLLVNKELLEGWGRDPSLVQEKITILKRLLKIRNDEIPFQASQADSQDQHEIGIWTSSPKRGILSKEKVEKLSGKDYQKRIFSCMNMKYFRSFLCQAFDKGLVLAAGLCCLYLCRQKYISNVSDPVSYGIITAGAIGFTRYILQDVDTVTTVPQGAIAEYVQELIKATVRREIYKVLQREIDGYMRGERAGNIQEENLKEDIDEKLVEKAFQDIGQEVPQSFLYEETGESLKEISEKIQRDIDERVQTAISERLKLSENGEEEISDKSYEEIMIQISRDTLRKAQEELVETFQGVVSEKVLEVSKKVKAELSSKVQEEVIVKNVQGQLVQKLEEDISKKEKDALEKQQKGVTEKRQMEEESQMVPEDRSRVLEEKFSEGLQQESKKLKGSLEKRQEQEVVTGEPLATGEKKHDILEKAV